MVHTTSMNAISVVYKDLDVTRGVGLRTAVLKAWIHYNVPGFIT